MSENFDEQVKTYIYGKVMSENRKQENNSLINMFLNWGSHSQALEYHSKVQITC